MHLVLRLYLIFLQKFQVEEKFELFLLNLSNSLNISETSWDGHYESNEINSMWTKNMIYCLKFIKQLWQLCSITVAVVK